VSSSLDHLGPSFGDQQAGSRNRGCKYLTDTSSPQIDSVDAFRQLFREPDYHNK
jgi:hypothetical protein